MSTEQREELVRLLKDGAIASGFPTELWTLRRIAQLLEQKFAVSMVPSSVWRLLGRLGWSVQRPTGQARERDERAGNSVLATSRVALMTVTYLRNTQ